MSWRETMEGQAEIYRRRLERERNATDDLRTRLATAEADAKRAREQVTRDHEQVSMLLRECSALRSRNVGLKRDIAIRRAEWMLTEAHVSATWTNDQDELHRLARRQATLERRIRLLRGEP